MDNNLLKNPSRGTKMIIGAIIALIALITILGLFFFFPMENGRSPLKNLFTAAVTLSKSFVKGEELILSSDTMAIFSGEPFTLSWKHTGKKSAGSYFFSYNCFPDVAIKALHLNENLPINCDSLYYFFSEDNTLTLRGSTKNIIDLPLKIAFIKSGQSIPSVEGTVVVTLVPKTLKSSAGSPDGTRPSATSTPIQTTMLPTKPKPPATVKKTDPEPTPKKPLTPGAKTENIYLISGTDNTPVNNPRGLADLAVNILEIGVINPQNNGFVSTSTLKSSDRIAVRFEVTNIGTKDSTDWYFNAVLPTIPWHIFTSPGQGSLQVGNKVEFVLGFNKIEKMDGNVFKIYLDPADSVKELSEVNNFATTTINGVRF